MKHTITVGKPITKGDKVVGYKDVREVPSNEGFRYNRNGFSTLDPAAIAALPKKKAAKPEAAKKAAKPAAAKTDDSEDLNELTVKQLRVIADALGVQGRLKADLIASIETARDEHAAAD